MSKKGGIEALSEFNNVPLTYAGFQSIDTITRDLKHAVNYSDLLILPVPSFAQEPLFIEMLPYLRNGQTIMLMPGNYGSLVLNKIKNEYGYKHLNITFVDAISIPWATRIGSAQLAILGMKEFLPVSAFPASETQNAIAKLQEVMPLPLIALENVICAGLEKY